MRISSGWISAAVRSAAGVCALVAATAAFAAGGWQAITPSGPVVGVDGKSYTARCSGFPGTDPTFKFWARQNPASRNLVVFFEGGGACWDNLTCSFPIGSGLPAQFFVPQVAPATDPAAYDGLFRGDRADNPVRNWNFVYIPYCTGDIHIGSSTRTYANAGNPLLPLPSYTIEHRGFDNFMVVLDWLRQNIDSPQRILVTGSSAGGYGATAHFPWLAETFPGARMTVIADASQGVTTPGFDAGDPGRNAWKPQLAPAVFGADLSQVPGGQVMRRAAAAYPGVKIGQFTTTFDNVQIPFYGLMKQNYGPGGSCADPGVDWTQQMVGALRDDASVLPNFRYYLAQGSYHTIMRSPRFYTESSGGRRFSNWLSLMLRDVGASSGRGGGRPNLACPGCLLTPSCP